MSVGRDQDERFMQMALGLAKRGAGRVSPNPMVGAVVVSPEGEVVARGYHKRYGGLHAEREALKRLDWKAPGATLYVNLEPCCHHGKTPPCTEAVIQSGVARVVVGMEDPNPLVSGKGVRILRQAGIDVRVGVLEGQCRHLNRAFVHFVTTGRPWVLLKWAQSLDGRIAVSSGESEWISCEESLRFAHRLRAQADAVLVGRGTVQHDDCRLTVRMVRGSNPLRVVIDSQLSLSTDKKVFSSEAKTVVYTLSRDEGKIGALRSKGVEVVSFRPVDTSPTWSRHQVPLDLVLEDLGRRGVANLLVEGGGEVLTSFLREGLANEVAVVIAPLVLGRGREAVGEIGVNRMEEGLRLQMVEHRRIGVDRLIRGLVVCDR